jgi:flagellar P-ring protein precursor FlgI
MRRYHRWTESPAAARPQVTIRLVGLLVLLLAAVGLRVTPGRAQTARVAELTTRAGEIPRRLVGYGLVVGLEGTGDRSFGGFAGQTPTVRSIVNLLKRFNVVVPPEAMVSRNVAAVLVTAEASPYLRAGGRFEVQVSSLGDASSLRGGVLWITPLVSDPNQPPVATAQGPVLVTSDDQRTSSVQRRGTSGRIPDGAILEVDPPPGAMPSNRLVLRRPDLGAATRIAGAINAAFGPGSAKVEDPGAIGLIPKSQSADSVMGFLAAVDTLPVSQPSAARIVINARDGTVVAGGDVRVGLAAVSHHGITLRVGPSPAQGGTGQGVLALDAGATVQDVAAGLHAAGATSQEVASVFEALRQVGAVAAEVAVQ